MILSCNNISKSFGTDIIIKSCSFNIEDHEKAAIVGINGAGKSTLLKIITGEEPADTGIVTLAKDKTLGYLAQQQDLQSDRSIYDELLSVKQYILDMESELRRIEAAMNNASGDELESLMNRYTNLNHEFEMNNGYAYKSEITGVLKGLGFAEEDFSLHVNTLSEQSRHSCIARVMWKILILHRKTIFTTNAGMCLWIIQYPQGKMCWSVTI